MQPLAVRILYVALIAVYGGVSSAAAVETKYPDGGFEPRLDKLQGLLDHIRTVEKVKVKAGPKLWQAITAIPVATGVPISGNDSIAAQFYLREGVNNPRALKNMKETLEKWGIPQGDTPFAIFQTMHRAVLDDQGYDYRFGNLLSPQHVQGVRNGGPLRELSVLPEGRCQAGSLRDLLPEGRCQGQIQIAERG